MLAVGWSFGRPQVSLRLDFEQQATTAPTSFAPNIQPNGPSKLHVAPTGARSAFIKWIDPVGSGGYVGPWGWQIEVYNGCKLVKTHLTYSHSWNTSGLGRHTKYTYEVRGVDGKLSIK